MVMDSPSIALCPRSTLAQAFAVLDVTASSLLQKAQP